MPRITLADLAAAAGVSMSTVDRLMNGRFPVRGDTAEMILATAERIGFYGAATIRSRLRTRSTDLTLGVVLHQSYRPFYANLGRAIEEAAANHPHSTVRARVTYAEDLSPEAIAANMLKLGQKADVISVVAAQHPQISRAIETLSANGVPTIALISEHADKGVAGFVGTDSVMLGRTAAWALDRICQKPGKIGIILGSHRYRCHEQNEIGFRSYLREHRPDLVLAEPVTNFEDREIAERTTLALLEREPNLSAILRCGGAVSGVVAALRQVRPPFSLPVVANEMSDDRRHDLSDGYLTLVFATPLRLMAERLIAAALYVATKMPAADAPEGAFFRQSFSERIPFDLFTSENI